MLKVSKSWGKLGGETQEQGTGAGQGAMPVKPKSSRVTLRDVALNADVSEVTASRALRNPELVSERLRARVVAAARELAYVPNQMASALASSRTGRVAVIVPSLTNGVFEDYLRAAHDMFTPAAFRSWCSTPTTRPVLRKRRSRPRSASIRKRSCSPASIRPSAPAGC
jgi:hypothetical protein